MLAATAPNLRRKLRNSALSLSSDRAPAVFAKAMGLMCAMTYAGARRVKASSRSNFVHGLGQFDIEIGDAARIMRGQRHFNLFVNIEPLRMVIHLFGHQRRARHEAKGLV